MPLVSIPKTFRYSCISWE